MRSNAMKTCAMGAMLFGGTLGVVSTAQAGLVWLRGGNVGDPTSALASVQVGNGSAPGSFADYNAYAEGVALSDPFNFPSLSTTFGAIAGGAPSMLFSGTDNFTGGSDTGGFSFSSNLATGNTGHAFAGWYGFTVSGDAVQVSFSFGSGVTFTPVVDTFGGLRIFRDDGVDGTGTLIGSWNSVGTTTFTLGPGVYYLTAEVGVNDGYSGNVMSFSVPAPGAFALVGLAGMITSRRRKA